MYAEEVHPEAIWIRPRSPRYVDCPEKYTVPALDDQFSREPDVMDPIWAPLMD